MKLVIIAGGKGTRLGLEDIPKPMVKLDGIPLLEHQINLAKRYEIKEIFILSGHLSEVIMDYFGNGEKFGVNITHIVEPSPLGTAGSMKLLENLIDERFIVFYGDVVMDFDIYSFIDFDKKHPHSLASIIVHPNDHPYDSDLVEMDKENRVVKFHPKPHSPHLYYSNIVNAAVYILSPEILKYIPTNESTDFGKHIFPKIIKEGEKVYAYKTPEYIKDIGTLDRLGKAEGDFVSGKISRLNKNNKRKAVFLDRDGVINIEKGNLSNIDEFELLDSVEEAVKKINKSEFLAVLITNQPVIAKGMLSEGGLLQIHKKMETLLGNKRAYLDEIYFCPHHPDKGFDGEVKELKIDCECRKPKPGMLLTASKSLNIDLEHSWMIGDREIDLLAGKNAGCKTVHLSNNPIKSEHADVQCNNLLEAVDFIQKNAGLKI